MSQKVKEVKEEPIAQKSKGKLERIKRMEEQNKIDDASRKKVSEERNKRINKRKKRS